MSFGKPFHFCHWPLINPFLYVGGSQLVVFFFFFFLIPWGLKRQAKKYGMRNCSTFFVEKYSTSMYIDLWVVTFFDDFLWGKCPTIFPFLLFPPINNNNNNITFEHVCTKNSRNSWFSWLKMDIVLFHIGICEHSIWTENGNLNCNESVRGLKRMQISI